MASKKITTFNLEESLIKEFDALCNAQDKSRSKVANRIIKNFVQAQHKKSKKR